jgi:endonuclease YncB( thermonuclease family)
MPMPKVRNPSAFSIAILVASIAAIVAAWPTQARGETQSVTGRVIGVRDGDSITVLAPGNEQLKVRLEGIDAPELKQPFSQQSKQALSDFVFSKTVVLQVTGKDRYKRTLAVVMVEGVNVNLEMVRRGFAWRFDKYSKDAELLAAQEEAKAGRQGLWRDPEPVPPWEWRAKGKTK